MANDTPLTKQSFDESVARLGISGSETHMEELFRQVQGVIAGSAALMAVDVSGVEPDMAFIASGSREDE